MAEEAGRLKLFWEHFFRAETGTYEKSTWLDLFLAEFIIRLNEGANPKELINFCPVSGVVSLVGCELLCGIHRVTSSINAHYSVPLPALDVPCSGKEPSPVRDEGRDEEKKDESRVQTPSLFTRNNAQSASDILRKYLLGGVAWRCLVLLKALGVEGLSCCRQLSAVLVWWFGELSAAKERSPRRAPLSPSTTNIHRLFSQRSRHGQGKTDPAENKSRRKNQKHSDQSSDSADSNEDLQILNRSLAIKVCSPNDDFEYFDSPVRIEEELPNATLYSDPFIIQKKVKPKADDYMTDRHKEIINTEVSTFEFTLLITDLLQELCRTESSLSGSEGSQISVQCINFSLRNLCSVQFGSHPQSQYDSEEVSRIKVALTELLIVSLDKVLIHSDLCAKLINNGILPMLLRVLEDVVCKSNTKYHTKDQNRVKQEAPSKTESENLLKFVFGIAYSITAFFHCLLMQCRTIDKLHEFTDQFKLYGECLKGGLLKECVELMIRIPGVDEGESVLLIKKLIESIGMLISGMKRVRSEVVHTAACPRSRHKICRQRVAAGMHHHHDILGEAGNGLSLSSACCISVLYGTLTSLLTDDVISAQSVLRNKILMVMLSCGVCCCFSPGFLMESIVRLMLTQNSIATLCLQVLEHTVYGDLGASILLPKVTDQLPCSICEPCDDERDLIRKYCPHGVNSLERKSVWSFLIHYNSLLQLDNHNNVLHATVSHLLRVTPKCRTEMRYELLFSVIYPTFIVAKHRYILRMEASAYFLTVSCLNIFASLLNTVSFAEQFIQKGGLSYVLELVSLSEFSNQCCSILEIAIIVQIFKLMKENVIMAFQREISSLPSIQMLFKSLTDVTDKCYKICRVKLPIDKFEELCDTTKEKEALAINVSIVQPRKLSTPKSMKTQFSVTESYVEESVEDHIEVLKNIWTFWKSCAALCLYSPMFREYVVGESVLLDSYALLKLLLYYMSNCECNMAEMRVLIKIMEALLTVQLAVSDVTSGRSKDTSCSLVRAALTSPGAVLEGGGALRALCEALIRVAVAEPSRQHTMPRLPHAKCALAFGIWQNTSVVDHCNPQHMLSQILFAEPAQLTWQHVPPLGCPSGSSSIDCSSSEDSAWGPYASEHSEPSTRADDGYEADVEIGKLDVYSSHRLRKLSSSLSTVSSVPGYQSANEMPDLQCAEYTKHGQLAHPELCIIVVDILTQLINKLLSSPTTDDAPNGNIQRVCTGLARACCVRLSGALARAHASPPNLLQRLLGPAAGQLLARKDDQLEDLQRSILELVYVLASRGISPSELAALLSLCAKEGAPLSLLLPALQRLTAHNSPPQPHTVVTQPTTLNNVPTQPLSEELNYVVVNGSTSQSQQAEALANRLQDSHLRAGITSCWSRSAARVGVEGAGWAPWLHGFAAAAWLRAQPANIPDSHVSKDDWDTFDEWQSDSHEESKKSPKKESPTKPVELSHVFSVGHESLMFEIWLNTATGCFTFRLTRPEANSNKTVSETTVDGGAVCRQWSFVAVNVREVVHKRRTHIQVTLYVNGCECETVSLPLQGILVRKIMPTNFLIGDAIAASNNSNAGVYHMSHCHVYRVHFTVYTALHMYAHGPDHSCRVRCESPNYPLLLTPNVLNSNIDWDQVYEISSSTLRELHDNLLLSFSAHEPTIANLYHQTVGTLPTVFAGRVPSTASLMASASLPPTGGCCIPETLAVTWSGTPLRSEHRSLTSAVYMLGGVEVLMFLFARVVELGATPEEQAMALSILLRACRVDNRLYTQLYGEDILEMLHTVFAAPKCRITHHLLKVFFDEACSSPILTTSGGGLLVLARSDAVLLEPRLLVLLTRAWRHLDTSLEISWEVESLSGARETYRGSLWALTLCCVRVLLRDGDSDHPMAATNHYQMSRVGLLRHLLTACKERFLNSECNPVDPSASSLVELVRGLMGAPPMLDRLALLCDFLLLMHQASDTFVTHSRANFYFLLTADTPDTTDFHSLFTRRRSSKRTRKHAETHSDIADARSSSSVTSEDMVDNFRETREMESSVESTKQMKGIYNMQIKEGRKHNVSSTSENSDMTVELHARRMREGAIDELSERKGEDFTLSDYVVIDEEDVTHTTVDMYASGIYQQRKVRAGAEPGWTACEGLLLLLRDIIGVLPEQAFAQAVCGAIQAESLVVLGNHRCAQVRAALVRALCALQRRAPPELRRAWRKHYLHLHLANQISLYPASWELATACAALLTKCDVPLEDQLDDDIWVDLSEDSIHRAPPLLAILSCCLDDVPLAHNVTLLIRRIIDKASLKMLSEVSVAEVVVRSIRAIGVLGEAQFEGRELLLNDLYQLLCHIAVKALALPHGMQTISDIHHMVTYLELTSDKLPNGETVFQLARDAQLALFVSQLDCLEERLHSSYTHHTKYANYFTTVLSSAVSLGSDSASRTERTELASRHLATVTRAVNSMIAVSPHRHVTAHGPLLDRLLATLLPAVSGTVTQKPKWWVGVSADWTTPLHELFWWVCSPAAGTRHLQPALLRALYPRPHAAPAPRDPPRARQLAVYLLSILKHIHAETEATGTPPVELAITDWARSWAVSTQAGLPDRLPSDTLAVEAERLLQTDLERWAKTQARLAAQVPKVIFSKDALANKLTETAMGITRQVVDIQNGERKAFMEHLRRAQSEAVTYTQRWQRLIDSYTHEQAVWHDPPSYPQSWQLDATEGPGRVRVRLARAHLRLPPKFLKPHARYKAEIAFRLPPLRSIVGACGLRGGLVARLQLNETVSYMARVTHVTVASETDGELLLSDRCIHFVPEDSEDEQSDKRNDSPSLSQSWPLEAVIQVATRRWCLQERAAELFLSSGHAHLLAFADVTERTAFLKALGTCHLPNRTEPDTLNEAMTQWRNGSITNWEYLMRLNGLGGRSYNDLMQYPVLPFVIADYTSRILDLNDPKSFRDLSKPMAIQNKNREQHYINTYNDLKAARKEGCSPLLSRQPHHYASLYSNSGGVLHYLVRLPPFTELFLNYQDNNFDMPDRTFHSLATTWRLITNDSPTDVKELIPELFYLPELLHNNEGLNLGVRQCGAAIDDVELPPWAADARLFTLINRQALESPLVTEKLPHWIDLVFGYKQTGQAAIDSINVFPACTYYGFDPSALEDSVDRLAARAMVRTYGQAPRQLLRAPHPHRAPDLAPIPASKPVWAGVEGASWGRYCGSPGLPPAVAVSRRQCAGASVVQALPHARAAVALHCSAAALLLPGTTNINSSQTGNLSGSLALLTWGHSDNIVRLKRRRDMTPELLLQVPVFDQITKVSTTCIGAGAQPVILGHRSGRLLVLRAPVAPAARVRTIVLHAHTATITDIYVCARAGLLATASADGKIVLWDLHKLSYIRTLPNRDMLPATHVTISETLCDVASVHTPRHVTNVNVTADVKSDVNANELEGEEDSYEKDATYKYKSLVRVHTCNARFVGSVKVSELVTCICYSNAPEGVSVNCVALGLANGYVRLYSSWDLNHVATVPPPSNTRPIALTSITFSSDSSLLFGCYADGCAVAWESGADKPAPVRLLPAYALL